MELLIYLYKLGGYYKMTTETCEDCGKEFEDPLDINVSFVRRRWCDDCAQKRWEEFIKQK